MQSCKMYGLFRLAGTLETWKVRYCTNEFTTCERFNLSAKGGHVPDNLLPNGQLLKRLDTPPR